MVEFKFQHFFIGPLAFLLLVGTHASLGVFAFV